MDDNRCAVIDLGSNTVHLAVFIKENGTVEKLLSKKENVGLLSFVENGAVTFEGMRRLCEAVYGLTRLCESRSGLRPDCIATASLRNVTNGVDIADFVGAQTGTPVRIISSEEEAALGLYGVLGPKPWSGGRGFVCDLGGGSSELTCFENGDVFDFAGLDFGSLTLFRRFVSATFPDADARNSIERFVKTQLERYPWLSGRGGALYAVGGTARAIARIHASVGVRQKPGMQYALSVEELAGFKDSLFSDEACAIAAIAQEAPDRVNTLPCGVLAFVAIARHIAASSVIIHKAGIREGYACSRLNAGLAAGI